VELNQLDPKVEQAARNHADIDEATAELSASVESPQDWRILLDEHGNLRALHEGPGHTSIEDGDLAWDGTTWQLAWRSP
jgi:hypothetical protein